MRIYNNWESEVMTKRQYENDKRNRNNSIYKDFFAQFKAYINPNNKLELYDKTKDIQSQNILGELDYQKLPWHENVAEIFELISNQYKIDIQTDWYNEINCFVSVYGKENEKIHIHCFLKEPNKNEIARIIDFANQTDNKPIKIVIAIEESGIRKTQKIEYFEIEYRYKEELLENLIDFTNYKNYIYKRFSQNEIDIDSGLTVADMYVSSSGVFESNKEDIKNIEEYILKWSKERTSKHLAVLGQYGQGKSILALKITYELLKTSDERIPILMELRGKSPRNLSLLEIVATWSSNFRIEPQAILKLHNEGKLVLIFEGFDEMDLVGDAEMRMNHFRNIWEFAKTPNAKIFITGRPNFFLDDIEQKEALGIYQPLSYSNPYCEALYLNSFSVSQIDEALRNTPSKTRNGILQLILKEKSTASNNTRFYDLVSRPSTLFLVSSIWDEAKFAERKDKINSAIVIREFISAAYERQGGKRNSTPLTVNEREYFMMGIAVGMMKYNGYSNQISKEKLNKLVLDLYDNFPTELGSTKSAFEKGRSPLKERMKENEEIAKDSILTDVRACGILIKDLSRINHFKFAHKSFMEYLVSEYYVLALLDKDTSETFMAHSISKSLNDSILSIKRSEETTNFVSQLIASEFYKESELKPEEKAKTMLSLLHKSKMFTPKFTSYFTHHILNFMMGSVIFIMSITMLYIYLVEQEPLLKPNSLFGSDNSILSIVLRVFIILSFVPMFIITNSVFKRYYELLKERNIKNTNLVDFEMGFKTKVKIWYLACKELSIEDSCLKKLIYSKYLKGIEDEVNSNQHTTKHTRS